MIIGAPLGLITEGYQARAVTFDGTNDYLTRGSDFTSNANSKVGIISCWINITGTDGPGQEYAVIDTPGQGVRLQRDATIMALQCRDISTTTILNVNSGSTTVLSTSGWVNVLCSWDLSTSSAHMYIDDVDVTNTTLITNGTIDYTKSEYYVGRDQGNTIKFNGDMVDVYFNNQEYIDISVEANRRKFISSAGKPVYLGNNGELPTGTSPRLFLSLAQGAAVSTFATNKGTGGGMTITGTLAEAATSPSD